MPRDFCCTHPSRAISPTIPSRPTVVSLDGIFAVAALPEDHPHALNIPERKPSSRLGKNIIHSPSVANKLRLHLHRKSTVKSLKADVYDEDARQITSMEVLDCLEKASSTQPRTRSSSPPQLRLREVSSLYSSPDLRRLQRSSPSPVRRVRSAHLLGSSCSEKSLGTTTAREPVKSVYAVDPQALKEDLSKANVAEPRGESVKEPNIRKEQMPAIAIACQNGGLDQEPLVSGAMDGAAGKSLRLQRSNDSIALHKMHISRQLRSLSQLSDPVEDYERLTPQPWTFHHRQRSNTDASLTGNSHASRHQRHVSGSGVDSASVPSSWGRVRASSSVYSRPTSPEGPVRAPYEIIAQLADWPLEPYAPHCAQSQASPPVTQDLLPVYVDAKENSTPTHQVDKKKSESLTEACRAAETKPLVQPDSSSQRACSIPSKSSVSTLTKHSRFFERFTPPKKTVRKRRSIFKFLRPGSHRQQPRSSSTPILQTERASKSNSYDGQVDDEVLLTVQYELSERRPTDQVRSISLGKLNVDNPEPAGLIAVPRALTDPTTDRALLTDPNNMEAGNAEAAGLLAVPGSLARQHTLADYERGLSVAGDDRRRPSTVNLHTLKEIHEDERRNSVGVKRALSRATPLRDDVNSLMKSALERHQQEKALFRSASKRKESIGTPLVTPSFETTTWSGTGSSLHAQLSGGKNEFLNQLDPDQAGPSSTSQHSNSHLLGPGKPAVRHQRRVSLALPLPSTPAAPADLDARSTTSPASPHGDIGAHRSPWARYPSYSRWERCGTAGPRDHVISRDFAFELSPKPPNANDETEVSEMRKKKWARLSLKGLSLRASLPRSRSATFDSIARYYANIFTSGNSTGQGRRTSIAAGGRLKHPELELLPPVMPDYTPATTSDDHHHYPHLAEQLAEMDEHVVEDVDILLHQQHHERRSTSQEGSPFREGSPFGPDNASRAPSLKREDSTMVSPLDGPKELLNSSAGESKADANVHMQHAGPEARREERNFSLDGTTDTVDDAKRPSPSSKAEVWSEAYKECLASPESPEEGMSGQHATDTTSMPPPALKPVKPRSPQRKDEESSQPKVRSYPSVTVIDDGKGHWRSVSFVSIRSNKSAGFVRESSYDLLALMEARERQEREELLRRVEDVC